MADKYRDPATFERITTLAWTQAQVQLHHLGTDARGGAPLPAGRQPDPLRRSAAARAGRDPRAQHARARGALGASDLGRSAHRAGPDRRDRGSRDRAPAPARARVLAHEGARGRSGDPEREAALVSARSAVRPRRAGARRTAARSARRPQGSIVVLRGDLLSAAERDCLAAAARVMLGSRLGTLAEQVSRAERAAAPRRRERRPSP